MPKLKRNFDKNTTTHYIIAGHGTKMVSSMTFIVKCKKIQFLSLNNLS